MYFTGQYELLNEAHSILSSRFIFNFKCTRILIVFPKTVVSLVTDFMCNALSMLYIGDDKCLFL